MESTEMPEPYYQDDAVTIYNGDCFDCMKAIGDSQIDLVFTDPPYFKVKDEWWDKQWETPCAFAEWIGFLCLEWQRIIKPNGSLYVFASPQMAWHVEGEVRKKFNVLNRITWSKSGSDEFNSGQWSRACKEEMRAFFPQTEALIFAEHFGADNIAKGEAGWVAKCDELRGFVFEPLRAYLAGEWQRAGLTAKDANEATGTQMAGHWFTRIQWALPTANHYKTLQQRANENGGEYLRRDYEELRRDYEELRRPFFATEDRPYTDVWQFKTVPNYPGKHPCEKPRKLLAHVVETSTKPGGIVFDCFGGSLRLAQVCREHNRKFIGVEINKQYCELAVQRLKQKLLF